jgi:tetratricopeptide (TPR) repeat protein
MALATPSPHLKAPGNTGPYKAEKTQFFSIAMLELAAEVPAWVKATQDHLRNRKWADAQKAAEEGLAKTPQQLEGLLFLAEAHWEQVHAKEAVDRLKQAIQVAPRDSRPYALLGRYLLLKGLREQAVSFLERAVTLNPDDTESRKQLDRTRNLIKRGYKKVDAAPGALGSPEVRKEATRMVTLASVAAATEEPLPPAEAPVLNVDVDRALAALLSADLFPIDVVKAKDGRLSSGRVLRVTVATWVILLAVALAIPAGLMVRKRVASARAGTPLTRARSLVAADTPSSYVQAAELLDKLNTSSPEYEAAQPVMAMAMAVREVDWGSGQEYVDAAERALSTAGALARRDPFALYARQLLRRGTGKSDNTLTEDLKAALLAQPTDAWLHLARARQAEDEGDDTTALEAYRRAHHKDPAVPCALHGLARAHARVGDTGEAVRLLRRLLVLQPTHAPGLSLGVLVSADQPDEQKGWLMQAESVLAGNALGPEDALMLNVAIGLTRLGQGQPGDAALSFERADAAAARMVNPPLFWARVQLALGNPESARAVLTRAVESDPSSVQAHTDLMRVDVLTARGPDAAKMQRSSSPTPAWPVVSGLLGTIYVRPGQVRPWVVALHEPAALDAELHHALDLPDLSANAKVMRIKAAGRVLAARALLSRGVVGPALALLKSGLEENKKDPELLVMLAQTHLVQDNASEAERAARTVLDGNPVEVRAALLLAGLLVDRGNVDEALGTLRPVEEAPYESARLFALQARAFLKKGDASKATRALQRAVALDPDDTEVLVATAEKARKESRDEDALNAYMSLSQRSVLRLRRQAAWDPLAQKALGAPSGIDAGAMEVAPESSKRQKTK